MQYPALTKAAALMLYDNGMANCDDPDTGVSHDAAAVARAAGAAGGGEPGCATLADFAEAEQWAASVPPAALAVCCMGEDITQGGEGLLFKGWDDEGKQAMVVAVTPATSRVLNLIFEHLC